MINLKKSPADLSKIYKYFCFMTLLFCVCTNTPDNCGGNHRYDPRTQFCHDGEPFDKCGGKEYNPSTYGCIVDGEDGKLEERCINGEYAISGTPCDTSGNPDTTDAMAPVIIEQPTSDTVIVGMVHRIFVNASVTDNGTLTYQWYSNTSMSSLGGTIINGAIDSVYSVSTLGTGTFYYYVIITNTNNKVSGNKTATARSDVVTVTVNPVINAATPLINEQPASSIVTMGGSHNIYVTATVTDSGTISYQWYRNTTASNSGGTVIDGMTGSFYPVPTVGVETGTYHYYVVVTNTNTDVNGNTTATTASNAVAITVLIPQGKQFNPDITYSSFIDERDSILYLTVKIGNQTWMAENLNYRNVGSFCFGNDTLNCEIYGRLYNWYAARDACPAGWHLPTREEWNELIETAGGSSVAGKVLKSKKGWFGMWDYEIDYSGTDEFGFSALPGGSRGYRDGFYNAGSDGTWRSATENISGTGTVYAFYIHSDDNVTEGNYHTDFYLSVRCILE
ncbi:MAG: hypothetical protein FWE57_08870 [Chitinispirillia bacterium]|nr:hypothetical protein [Chitinispirillia bacterium]